MRVGGAAEALGLAADPVVVERAVAQLDDVDAAAQRRLEQRVVAGGGAEVQAGVPEALAGACSRPAAYAAGDPYP